MGSSGVPNHGAPPQCPSLGEQEGPLANGLTSSHQDNRLLAALPREMLDLIGYDLRQISLAQGKSLYEPGAPIDEIYFPQTGMIYNPS
jgi:hypothetical protein